MHNDQVLPMSISISDVNPAEWMYKWEIWWEGATDGENREGEREKEREKEGEEGMKRESERMKWRGREGERGRRREMGGCACVMKELSDSGRATVSTRCHGNATLQWLHKARGSATARAAMNLSTSHHAPVASAAWPWHHMRSGCGCVCKCVCVCVCVCVLVNTLTQPERGSSAALVGWSTFTPGLIN